MEGSGVVVVLVGVVVVVTLVVVTVDVLVAVLVVGLGQGLVPIKVKFSYLVISSQVTRRLHSDWSGSIKLLCSHWLKVVRWDPYMLTPDLLCRKNNVKGKRCLEVCLYLIIDLATATSESRTWSRVQPSERRTYWEPLGTVEVQHGAA